MSVILNRLKKTWECNDSGEGNCSCGCCGGDNCSCQSEENKNEEFVLKENLSDEEIEEIIESEYKDKNSRTKKFIKSALRKHGNKFSYQKTCIPDDGKVYKDYRKTKITITCLSHNGDITITIRQFLEQYKGCYVCNHGRERCKNTEQFKKELNEKNPNYELMPGEEYINAKTKLKFVCKIHNCIFEVTPDDMLSHTLLCPTCRHDASVNRFKELRGIKEAEFREKMKLVYGNTYNIIELNLIDDVDCLKFHCNKCGTDTEMSAYVAGQYMNGERLNTTLCPVCKSEENRIIRENAFKEKINSSFPERFDLTNLHYITNQIPATGIKCNHCGREFTIGSPGHFIQLGGSCPYCSMSSGEAMILNWLEKHSDMLSFIPEFKVLNSTLLDNKDEKSYVLIDFYTVYNNIEYFIEYNGYQHYNFSPIFFLSEDDYNTQINRDIRVKNYCDRSGIILIEIPYTYKTQNKVSMILDEVILNGTNPVNIINIPNVKPYGRF